VHDEQCSDPWPAVGNSEISKTAQEDTLEKEARRREELSAKLI
jgi:hypothetical protein